MMDGADTIMDEVCEALIENIRDECMLMNDDIVSSVLMSKWHLPFEVEFSLLSMLRIPQLNTVMKHRRTSIWP